MRIKTWLNVLLASVLVAACSPNEYDDTELKSAIGRNSTSLARLEAQMAEANNAVLSLRSIVAALQQDVYISSVTQENGAWQLYFTNGTFVTLPDGKNGIDGKDGRDGNYMGIDLYEGIYYWTITVNGRTSWLYDTEGHKIRVTGPNGKNGKDGVSGTNGTNGQDGQDGQDGQNGGNGIIGGAGTGSDGLNGQDGQNGQDGASPLLCVGQDGYWEVSLDDGNTYSPVYDESGNRISALGVDGISNTNIFQQVRVYPTSVYVVLLGGTAIELPRLGVFYLTFSRHNNISIAENGVATVSFTVTGADSDTHVECCGHGNLNAKSRYKKGDGNRSINIRLNGTLNKESKVVVFLFNKQTTITYVLNFAEGHNKWDIPDDEDTPVPGPDGDEDAVSIPDPGTTVEDDGGENILSVTLTGIQLTDGSWLDVFGTGDPRQNIWVDIDGRNKGFLVEEVTEGQASAKADLVFLVDNSGTMNEEANAIARDITNWSQQLAASNLDIRFGIVGYDGCIHGAMNLTTASALNSYLNRSGLSGTNRTKGFSGADANMLETAADRYPKRCQYECDGAALRYADELYNFRSGANRIYVNFTDEPNQPNGNPEYSVEYVRDKNKWGLGRGTIHTVFSESKESCSGSPLYYNEYPWLFSEYTGGTTLYTSSSFSGVDLNKLPVTGALTHTVILRMRLPESLLVGTHTLTIVVKDKNGRYYQKRVFTNVTFTK